MLNNRPHILVQGHNCRSIIVTRQPGHWMTSRLLPETRDVTLPPGNPKVLYAEFFCCLLVSECHLFQFRVAMQRTTLPLHKMIKSQRFPCLLTLWTDKDPTWVPGVRGATELCSCNCGFEWIVKPVRRLVETVPDGVEERFLLSIEAWPLVMDRDVWMLRPRRLMSKRPRALVCPLKPLSMIEMSKSAQFLQYKLIRQDIAYHWFTGSPS